MKCTFKCLAVAAEHSLALFFKGKGNLLYSESLPGRMWLCCLPGAIACLLLIQQLEFFRVFTVFPPHVGNSLLLLQVQLCPWCFTIQRMSELWLSDVPLHTENWVSGAGTPSRQPPLSQCLYFSLAENLLLFQELLHLSRSCTAACDHTCCMINFLSWGSRKRWVSQLLLRWFAPLRRKSTGRRGWVSPALELIFQSIAGGQHWCHIGTTGNAPGQGCSLGTAHIWTAPTPFPRVFNSHYLHFFVKWDRQALCHSPWDSSRELRVLSWWLKWDPCNFTAMPGRIQGLFLLRANT